MTYLLILVFIPFFFVGLVVYCATVYQYALNGNLDVVFVIGGLLASLISSFIILKTFALMDLKGILFNRIQKRIDAIIGLFSFTLLFIFGIALIVNYIKVTPNIAKIILGIGICVFYLYIFYYYVLNKKRYLFTLKDITKINDKSYLFTFENEKQGNKEYYVKKKEGYTKGKKYICSYSTLFNDISRIIKEDK